MSKEINELAKMFVDRENKVHSGIQIGIVDCLTPIIKISLGDEVLLTGNHLVFLSDLVSSLVVNDEVIIMPNQSEQLFFVLGKAVRL